MEEKVFLTFRQAVRDTLRLGDGQRAGGGLTGGLLRGGREETGSPPEDARPEHCEGIGGCRGCVFGSAEVKVIPQ